MYLRVLTGDCSLYPMLYLAQCNRHLAEKSAKNGSVGMTKSMDCEIPNDYQKDAAIRLYQVRLIYDDAKSI